MRKCLSYAPYLVAFLVYSFLTLPWLLPNISDTILTDKYDAIIVLGGGITTNCDLDASMQSRMNTAIDLYKEGRAKHFILTGGPQLGSDRCHEAESMRQYALDHHIPDPKLIKENFALNTYQNAYYSIELMKQRGMNSALVVTSDFHLKRAHTIFSEYENFQFKMIGAISKTKGWAKYRERLKEQVLLCFHTVFGVPDRFGLDLKEQNIAEVLKSLAAS